VTFSPTFTQFLAKESVSAHSGARAVRKNIQRHVENTIAHHLAKNPEQKKMALDIQKEKVVIS